MLLKLDRRKKIYVVSRDRDLSWYRRHLPGFSRSYYVYGDGIRDGDAINEAVDLLPKNPGGEIALLEGQYNDVAVDLAAKTRVTISGTGQSTIVVGDGVNSTFKCTPLALQHYYTFKDFLTKGKTDLGLAFELAELMDVTLENIWIRDIAYGIDSDHCTFDKYHNINGRNIATKFFYFHGGGDPIVGGNDHYLHSIVYDSDAAMRPDGIHVQGSGALVVSASDFLHCDRGLLIDPGVGETAEWSWIQETYFNRCDQQALHIAGAGVVRGMFFDDAWFATCGQAGPGRDGVVINNANIDGVTFNNCHCHNHHGSGYYIDNGKNIKIKGGEVAGNNVGGIGANGIYINDQVEVRAVYLGRMFTWVTDPLWHIFLGAAANALIENNDFDANALAGSISVGGAYRIRQNRGFVTENSGTAAIVGAATSVVVNHGLNVTPTAKDICVTPAGGWGGSTVYWFDTVGAAQFTIRVWPAPGGVNVFNFAWKAAVY